MENPEKLATNQQNKTICVGHHYKKTSTNNVIKTCVLLETHVWRYIDINQN
jgi:hypothetical protein